MSEEIRGKLAIKAGNGKGFKIEGVDGWFNANDNVKPYLAKIETGNEVIVNYTKKGVGRNVTKIMTVNTTNKTQSTTKETTKPESEVKKSSGTPVCEDCGVELKTDKYPKCYMCGKKAYKKSETKKAYSGSGYGSPEDIAGKEVGCATNAAATILSGRQENVDTLLEMFRLLVDGILTNMRELK